jgi:hypothetical protein
MPVGFGDRKRIMRRRERRLHGFHIALALLDGRGRHDPHAELARAVVVAGGEIHLSLCLIDVALGLRDGGVSARDGGVVLGAERVELVAVELGEQLALGDVVAVLGVDFDNGEVGDLGRHHHLLARDERAGYEQPVGEATRTGDGDCHGRRLDFARRVGGGGIGRAFGPRRGAEPVEREPRRLARALRPLPIEAAAGEAGENDQGEQQTSHRQTSESGARRP